MKLSSLLTALALSLGATVALAGEGNTLYLVQEQQGSTGNSFLSDQSAASYTSIGTIGQLAMQKGSGHSADLRLSGDCTLRSGCGIVLLNQDNTTAALNAPTPALLPTAPMAGNKATLTLSGTGNAKIGQLGDNNTAVLNITGGGDGTVEQDGLGNSALLTVAGGAGGTILQNGNMNTADLSVLSGPQTSVVLTQTGTGLNYPAGVQVVTTQPGTITITQSN
jgi:hypothetical protein